MGKECCAYREAALAAGKKGQMTDRTPVDRSLGDVARFQRQIFALSYRLSRSRLSDEQIGVFAFQKRRKLFD